MPDGLDLYARQRRGAQHVAAQHEAGGLLQAGLNLKRFATLGDVLRGNRLETGGPVLFKIAGWDLAAARAALAVQPKA